MRPDEIKFLRRERGWTQQKLAAAVGVAVSSVARWESPAGRPPKGASLRVLENLLAETRQGAGGDPDGAERGDQDPEARQGSDLAGTVAGIMGDMKCPKGFSCAQSSFERLCRARDIGMATHLECLEATPAACTFAVPYEHGHLCECPLRGYVFRKLNR